MNGSLLSTHRNNSIRNLIKGQHEFSETGKTIRLEELLLSLHVPVRVCARTGEIENVLSSADNLGPFKAVSGRAITCNK
jgi:hypothetical protein